MSAKKKATNKKPGRPASLAAVRYLREQVKALTSQLTALTQFVKIIDDRAALKQSVNALVGRTNTLESHVDNIDRKTDPARGTVARRLELLEATMEIVSQRTTKQEREHREFLDELARVRVQQRALILTLQEWAPGDANTVNSLPFLLQHTAELSPPAGEDDDAGAGQ